MSGPVDRRDEERDQEPLAGVEVREGRTTDVAGLAVQRVLPTKGRRTVGPWCFVDLMGPVDAEEPDPMEVGPHPHIGLSTVTWLLEGEALHTDSLGSEQVIRPGQLNLMTAGHGIAHAELAARPPFRGAQMWLAQPDRTRNGDSAFVHHADLPEVDLGGATGLLFVGGLGDDASPARAESPAVGIDVTMHGTRAVLPTDRTFEHAVAPLDGRVRVGDEIVEPGWLGLVPAGLDELPLHAEHADTRFLVLGGAPIGRIQMWWNFVARDRDELTDAWRAWRDRTDRFGDVSSKLDRIEAPVPAWVTPDG